ncbi:SDH family Clp fold serine proteinase [Bordetella bronchialis]|uniref:SDH family Clp fold serine proteinase n=1 Tax=Bordetella bronchialis TaxID=463025 RepID=UPI003D06C0D1
MIALTGPQALKEVRNKDTDVFAYAGPIDSMGYDRVCEAIPATRRSNALLYLCTSGGDPNAGYRIARAFVHNYGADKFRVAIPAECKSAGTLICVGAHELVMFDKGELGPLDVQFQKQDEIFQQSSGLDILRGMTHLEKEALQTFNEYLMDINGGSGLTTKTASEIASNLVIGLYNPIFGQVDPIKLGEMRAALQIAHHYGTRLNDKSKNLKADALRKLINEYPTHGFVIDRAEARTLFERVVPPTEAEIVISQFVTDFMWQNGRAMRSTVFDLLSTFQDLINESPDANQPQHDAPGSASEGDGANDAGPATSHDEAGPSESSDTGNAAPDEGNG